MQRLVMFLLAAALLPSAAVSAQAPGDDDAPAAEAPEPDRAASSGRIREAFAEAGRRVERALVTLGARLHARLDAAGARLETLVRRAREALPGAREETPLVAPVPVTPADPPTVRSAPRPPPVEALAPRVAPPAATPGETPRLSGPAAPAPAAPAPDWLSAPDTPAAARGAGATVAEAELAARRRLALLLQDDLDRRAAADARLSAYDARDRRVAAAETAETLADAALVTARHRDEAGRWYARLEVPPALAARGSAELERRLGTARPAPSAPAARPAPGDDF